MVPEEVINIIVRAKYKGWSAYYCDGRANIFDWKCKHVCHVIFQKEPTEEQLIDQIKIVKELKKIWRIERLRSWRR